MTQPTNPTIMEWGAVMRLACRASALATEDQRVRGTITDPAESAITLYKDWTREVRKYRPGDCIPVFHNICGRRTTYFSCDCKTCRSPWFKEHYQ